MAVALEDKTDYQLLVTRLVSDGKNDQAFETAERSIASELAVGAKYWIDKAFPALNIPVTPSKVWLLRMDDDFVSSNTGALTMEAARYNLQLRRLAASSTQLENAEQAARQITDRLESAVSDLRRALSELRTLTGTSSDHVQVPQRATESRLKQRRPSRP